MKKKVWILPIVLLVFASVILFRPAGRITFDKSVSKNRILFQYEIFGCGSLIGKVLDGGEEIVADYIDEYPDIGTNEVAFTDNSDEPQKHMSPPEFFTAGLAERYTYIVEGKPVGVTRGAPECCDPKPAYNENVVEFEVDKWYFTSYVPYITVSTNLFVLLTALASLFVAICGLVILLLISVFRFIKNKKRIM